VKREAGVILEHAARLHEGQNPVAQCGRGWNGIGVNECTKPLEGGFRYPFREEDAVIRSRTGQEIEQFATEKLMVAGVV
jgi:hypothetical protein